LALGKSRSLESMSTEEKIRYWVKSSRTDWKVANHLFEKGDYAYALFFGHLTIEKLLKAIFVKKFNEAPPRTHRLVFLAEKVELGMSSHRLELLEVITDFNLEARYPDEKFSFLKKCTREFAKEHLRRIGGLRRWLLKQVPSRRPSKITLKN
jgi:HEPN domain-containing protein